MALVAREVTFAYAGGGPLIQGLSLDLSAGRVLALCGCARSGRTTMLSLLTGLLVPQGGSVTVDGRAAHAQEARGRVGLLLQNADEGLFGLTVRDDVLFAPKQLALADTEASERANRALRVAGLDPQTFGARSPFSLSGGQRRRVAMAGVLAMNPTYLLLDEPFSGLDPQGRAEIVTVIRTFAQQGLERQTGMLVALTDLELALSLADTILIMHGGTLVWQGSVEAFLGELPDVARWGLRQPDLLAVLAAVRQRGGVLEVFAATPAALAEAIVQARRVQERGGMR